MYGCEEFLNEKKLFLFAFLLICASCFAGVFDTLIGNRYKGSINSNGVNYELYYEVQTEFCVMKLKMLKPTEK